VARHPIKGPGLPCRRGEMWSASRLLLGVIAGFRDRSPLLLYSGSLTWPHDAGWTPHRSTTTVTTTKVVLQMRLIEVVIVEDIQAI